MCSLEESLYSLPIWPQQMTLVSQCPGDDNRNTSHRQGILLMARRYGTVRDICCPRVVQEVGHHPLESYREFMGATVHHKDCSTLSDPRPAFNYVAGNPCLTTYQSVFTIHFSHMHCVLLPRLVAKYSTVYYANSGMSCPP